MVEKAFNSCHLWLCRGIHYRRAGVCVVARLPALPASSLVPSSAVGSLLLLVCLQVARHSRASLPHQFLPRATFSLVFLTVVKCANARLIGSPIPVTRLHSGARAQRQAISNASRHQVPWDVFCRSAVGSIGDQGM